MLSLCVMPGQLEIQLHADSHGVVLTLRGELDLASVPEFEQKLREIGTVLSSDTRDQGCFRQIAPDNLLAGTQQCRSVGSRLSGLRYRYTINLQHILSG